MRLQHRTINGVKFIEGSGNVFLDLGFPPGEACGLQLRCDMVMALTELVESEALTIAEAAKRFHVSQSRVRDVTKGSLSVLSLEDISSMLTHAGFDVEIRVKRRPGSKPSGGRAAASARVLAPSSRAARRS